MNAHAWFGLVMIVAVLGYGTHLVRQGRRHRENLGRTATWRDQVALLICALVLAGVQFLVILWLDQKSPGLSRVVFYAVSFVAAFALVWLGNRFAGGLRQRANKRHHGN